MCGTKDHNHDPICSFDRVMTLCITLTVISNLPGYLTLLLPNSDNKIFVSKFWKKSYVQAIPYWEFKDQRANRVDLDAVAHYEPLHLDLRCLQIQLFLSLVLKALKPFISWVFQLNCSLKHNQTFAEKQNHMLHRFWQSNSPLYIFFGNI